MISVRWNDTGSPLQAQQRKNRLIFIVSGAMLALITVGLVLFFLWPRNIRGVPGRVEPAPEPVATETLLNDGAAVQEPSIVTPSFSVDQIVQEQQKKKLIVLAVAAVVVITLLAVVLIMVCCLDWKEEQVIEPEMILPEPEPELEEDDESLSGRWILLVCAVVGIVGVAAIRHYRLPKPSDDINYPGALGSLPTGDKTVGIQTPHGVEHFGAPAGGVTRQNILEQYLVNHGITDETEKFKYVIIEGLVEGNRIFPLRKVFSIVDTTREGLKLAFWPSEFDDGPDPMTVECYFTSQNKCSGIDLNYAYDDVQFRRLYNKFIIENLDAFKDLTVTIRDADSSAGDLDLIRHFLVNSLYRDDKMATQQLVISSGVNVSVEDLNETQSLPIKDFDNNCVLVEYRMAELQKMIKQLEDFKAKHPELLKSHIIK